MSKMEQIQRDTEVQVQVEGKSQTVGEVYVFDDDYTPMEFVVDIIVKVFSMPYDHAVKVMLLAHEKGKASCGFFSIDVAETKAQTVLDFAQEKGYPLRCKVV